jgi:2-oxo-4-hydroxy-4-carboxy-5-ureidoimidazoline decarboxylase
MAQASSPATLAEINDLDEKAFVDLFGGVFEHSPWVAQAAWPARPFTSVDHLHRAMADALEAADEAQKLALLRAHPELAGREAEAGTLTDSSTEEQKGAGLSALTHEEAVRIKSLNATYQERFGFPFIIAARNHTKDSILNELERRTANDPATEFATNLQQVLAITRLRLDGLVADDS